MRFTRSAAEARKIGCEQDHLIHQYYSVLRRALVPVKVGSSSDLGLSRHKSMSLPDIEAFRRQPFVASLVLRHTFCQGFALSVHSRQGVSLASQQRQSDEIVNIPIDHLLPLHLSIPH